MKKVLKTIGLVAVVGVVATGCSTVSTQPDEVVPFSIFHQEYNDNN